MKKIRPIVVSRHGTGEKWLMSPINELFVVTEHDFGKIVEICNEPKVYEILFQQKLSGKPYSLEQARSFIYWAKEGWENDTHFVFLLRDTDGQIGAAVDIKSNNLDSSEVGYWATNHKPGIMTNAVLALCQIARENLYKSLYALVRTDNPKSIAVLEKVGFKLSTEGLPEKKDGHIYNTYVSSLN